MQICRGPVGGRPPGSPAPCHVPRVEPLQAPQLPQASGAVPVGGGRPRSAVADPRELSAAEGLGPGEAPSEPSTQRRHGTWRRTHPANPTLGGIGRGQPWPMAERGTRSPHPANPRSGTRQPPPAGLPNQRQGRLLRQLGSELCSISSAERRCARLSLRSSRGSAVRGRTLARARSSRGRALLSAATLPSGRPSQAWAAPGRPSQAALSCCRAPQAPQRLGARAAWDGRSPASRAIRVTSLSKGQQLARVSRKLVWHQAGIGATLTS
ncbi:uncharacterized protein LOC130684778 [Manis pentadactyla]|uniref:uncharacterized protein LOC130684778 n=1 Tax=Manis pentadactyla TaxID=143292 RepID=UPI00255CF9A6|nr:uncharacterized protein LOC130684778 [Manis pentadactyla]